MIKESEIGASLSSVSDRGYRNQIEERKENDFTTGAKHTSDADIGIDDQ